MNEKLLRILGSVALLAFAAPTQAVEIDLFDWGFNIDGTTYCDIGPCDNDGLLPGDLPASIDASGFDFSAFGPTAGLGTISVTISGAGAHSFDFFVDHDIDFLINGFDNELGGFGGALAPGQSAEADEPGFAFGDIFDNFLASALDGTVLGGPEDISMALGWDFVLGEDEVATIELLLSDVMPDSGFFLSQFDPDSEYAIYLSSTLTIEGGPPMDMPEPGTLVLVGVGLLGLVVARWRRRRR